MNTKKLLLRLEGMLEHRRDAMGKIVASGGAPSDQRMADIGALEAAIFRVKAEREYMQRMMAEGKFNGHKPPRYWDAYHAERFHGATESDILAALGD